jgi:hypothetical protein
MVCLFVYCFIFFSYLNKSVFNLVDDILNGDFRAKLPYSGQTLSDIQLNKQEVWKWLG